MYAVGTIRLNEQEFFSYVHVLFFLSLWSAYYAGVREVDDLLDRVLPALAVRGGDGHLPLLVPLLLHPQGISQRECPLIEVENKAMLSLYRCV
jgi:hypothetical protein